MTIHRIPRDPYILTIKSESGGRHTILMLDNKDQALDEYQNILKNHPDWIPRIEPDTLERT